MNFFTCEINDEGFLFLPVRVQGVWEYSVLFGKTTYNLEQEVFILLKLLFVVPHHYPQFAVLPFIMVVKLVPVW